jgi:chromate transporter
MTGTVPLSTIILVFAQLSLVAFGGANAILPDMYRQVVDVQGWLSGREFAALYALAQAAPGPNLMVVTLIGWRVAGLAGALVATLAVALPSSVLIMVLSGVWDRFRGARWRRVVQAGLMPVTAGLIMAGAAVLVRQVASDWITALVLLAALPLFLFTKLHPLLILGAAALLGAIGGGG